MEQDDVATGDACPVCAGDRLMTCFSSLAALLMLAAATQAPAQGPVTSVYTIDSALKAAEKLVTRKATWSGKSKLQKEWLAIRKEITKDSVSASWLEAFASRSVEEVNGFLKRNVCWVSYQYTLTIAVAQPGFWPEHILRPFPEP
jgi:hypothetical protein